MPRRGNQRGNILIIALLVSASLLLLGNLQVLTTLHQHRLQTLVDGRVKAVQLAKAGVAFALWEYNYGGAYFTGDDWQDASGDVRCPVQTRCVSKAITTVESTSLSRINDASNAINIFVSAYDSLNPEIISTGTHGQSGASTRLRVSLTQTAIPSPFQQAIYGTIASGTGIYMSLGSGVDAYDSQHGAYGSLYTDEFGNIGINQTSDALAQTSSSDATKAMDIKGAARIKGDAKTAPGGVVNLNAGAEQGYVEGSIGTSGVVAMPAPVVAEPMPCTSTQTFSVQSTWGNQMPSDQITDPVTGQKVLQLQGAFICYGSIIIEPGYRLELPNLRYLKANSLISIDGSSLDGNGTLSVGQGTIVAQAVQLGQSTSGTAKAVIESTSGAVDMYARSYQIYKAELSGKNKIPENFRFYYSPDLGSASGLPHSFDKDAKIYGVIYTPNVTTLVGNEDDPAQPGAELFGAIVSKQGALGRSNLHFDKQLKTVQFSWPVWMSGSNTAKRVLVASWRQEG